MNHAQSAPGMLTPSKIIHVLEGPEIQFDDAYLLV